MVTRTRHGPSPAALLPAVVFLTASLALAQPAAPQPNPQAVQDVAAGKVTLAKASWWGFDPADSTRALQAAINSGVAKLIVDNVGRPWITDKLTLAGDQEILFEKGVEVVAKRGAFLGRGDSLMTASLKADITLSGYGATLRMWRADYDAPPYAKAEWRHCLQFRSCRNVRVLGLTLRESGGDGIYLGAGKAGVTNRDILIKDVVCDANYRQGISVITAENLLIEDCVLKNTAGTAPMAGIDFEPNSPQEPLVNCVMRNCLCENNAGYGYVLALASMTSESTPISFRFENCRSRGNKGVGWGLHTNNPPDRAVRGQVEVTGCTFENDAMGGIAIRGKPADRCPVLLGRCSVIDPAPGNARIAPIVLSAGGEASQPVGGVRLDHCLVRDDLGRPPLSFGDYTRGASVEAVTGTLSVECKGRKTELDLTPEVLARLAPSTAFKRFPRFAMAGVTWAPVPASQPAGQAVYPFVRNAAHLACYARAGQEVSFTARFAQVGHYDAQSMTVRVIGPDDKEAARASVPFKQESKVSFQAARAGLYRVEADAGINKMQVAGASSPLCLTCDQGPLHLIGSTGRFYFAVPPGTRQFAVKAWGEGENEAVRVALYDPAGKCLEEHDNVVSAVQMVVTLPPSTSPLVYCVQTARPTKQGMEDYYIQLQGVAPLLGVTPDGVLSPKP